eukprot:Rhum_TRINITY_DN12254_c3_g1::Rhum_TRINITY_DN12254_c3_g1_i1::g.50258::m.50258
MRRNPPKPQALAIGRLPNASSQSVIPDPPTEQVLEAIEGLRQDDNDRETVLQYLKVLQVVVWKRKDTTVGRWVEIDRDDDLSSELEKAWRDSLTVALGTSGEAVCRICNLVIKLHPYCSGTGRKHAQVNPELLHCKRTYLLPGKALDLFQGEHLPSLVEIMKKNMRHLEVVVFCMMVMTQMTSPKLAVETNKNELLQAGAIEYIIDSMRRYDAIEVMAQDASAVLRNLLTNVPTQAEFEKRYGPATLIATMDRYPLNNELVHRACGCLLILSSQKAESRKHLFERGVVKTMCTVLATPYGKEHMVRRLVISIFQKLVKSIPAPEFKEEMDKFGGFTTLQKLFNSTGDDDREGMRLVLNVRGDLPRGTFVDPNVLVIDEEGRVHYESFVTLQKSNETRDYKLDPPTPKTGPSKLPDDLPAAAASSPLFPSPCSFASYDEDDDDEGGHQDPFNMSQQITSRLVKARTPGGGGPVQGTITDVIIADDDLAVHTSDNITTPSTFHQIEADARHLDSFLTGSPRASKMKKVAKATIAMLDAAFTEQGTFERNADFTKKLYEYTGCMVGEVSRLLEGQPKLIDIAAPVYVFGDIHGNFGDLQYFMKKLTVFENLDYSPYSFLFVGDYVDRGKWGPEVVAYLFALKLLSPRDIIMLRGNHEDVMVNGDKDLYGDGCFRQQILRCFDSAVGFKPALELFDSINRCFKHFPIAAIIEKKVFCTHGGIPRFDGGDDVRLDTLRDPNFGAFDDFVLPYKLDMSDPVQRQQVYAHDCVWSDPSFAGEMTNEYGFGQSSRGGQVLSYSQSAIHSFLDATGLEFIVRGHEEKADGLNVSKQARVMTVFSTSDYCRKGNKAGVALVRRLANGDLVCRMIHRAKPANQQSAYQL